MTTPYYDSYHRLPGHEYRSGVSSREWGWTVANRNFEGSGMAHLKAPVAA